MEVVITRHLFSFILAGVVAASTIFPASAWSRDSFISGGEEYEDTADVALSDIYVAPRRARMVKVSAADQAAAEAGTTGKLVVPATLPTSVDGTFQVMSKHYYKSSAGGITVESDVWDTVVYSADPVIEFQPSGAANYVRIFFVDDFVYSPDVDDKNDMIRGLAAFCDKSNAIFPPWYTLAGASGGGGDLTEFTYTLSYDVSAFASSAFSLDGVDSQMNAARGPYWPNWRTLYANSVDVLVDGQQMISISRGVSNYIDFGGYVYSGSANISTISLRWHMPFLYFVSDTSPGGSYRWALRSNTLSTASNALTISFLDGQDVINAQNDKTKSDINKHDEYESQWTGSMTENFNKLDFGNFSFTAGMLGGLNLVSGLFMDVWNALGGGAVIYVFPLYLGLILLLVGRISRSGGKPSSSGKGDDTS